MKASPDDFRIFMSNLATIHKSMLKVGSSSPSFKMTTTPHGPQRQALDALGVKLD